MGTQMIFEGITAHAGATQIINVGGMYYTVISTVCHARKPAPKLTYVQRTTGDA